MKKQAKPQHKTIIKQYRLTPSLIGLLVVTHDFIGTIRHTDWRIFSLKSFIDCIIRVHSFSFHTRINLWRDFWTLKLQKMKIIYLFSNWKNPGEEIQENNQEKTKNNKKRNTKKFENKNKTNWTPARSLLKKGHSQTTLFEHRTQTNVNLCLSMAVNT